MPNELISSAQNPKIKRLLALQKDSSLRRECGLFVVEGRRELERCAAAGFTIDSIFFCPDIFGPLSLEGPALREGSRSDAPGLRVLQGQGTKGVKIFEVSREVYDRVAYRGGTEGIIAEVFTKSIGLSDLDMPDNPLIMVLESVEKPGNLGAVLRSADAAGADAVLICDPLTDLWNPNLIRASTGTVFTVPTVACTSAEAITWLRKLGVQILTAQLQDSSLYYDCDMTRGTALVMGTESTGLSPQWREAATSHIRIPMLGTADSLNVSVSAAILLFEAVRQRL